MSGCQNSWSIRHLNTPCRDTFRKDYNCELQTWIHNGWLIPYPEKELSPPRGLILLIAIVQHNKGKVWLVMAYCELNDHVEAFMAQKLRDWCRKGSDVSVLYTTLFALSSITALIIPIMVTLCHNLVRLPPISLLQRGKKQIKSSFQESDHAQPCPTLWFFKSKADGPVWKEEGLLAAEDWTPKGYIYCRTKRKIITPISAVDKKRVYKTSKLQMATKICGCDV